MNIIEELIKEPESSKLEFKENFNPQENIIATIIAFANCGGGKLIIGVNDKTRHITGITDPQKAGESIINKIHDTVEPRILPNIEIIPYRNTYVIIIEIYPSPLKPHFKKKEGRESSTYIRIGSTTRRADQALIKVIERSVIVKSFDEEPCTAANYEEIDLLFAERLFKDRRSFGASDLVSLNVLIPIGNGFVPTIGGILLLARDRLQYFRDAYIKVGIFEDNNKNNILDTKEFTGFFPEAIKEVLNFLKKNMRVGLKIEDLHHQEVWEIPKIALREALVNAILHTDYSITGTPITVNIFDDRIEIENSALLQWGFTFEELKLGISKIRNPVIARVFNEIGLIEQWGSGLKRMISSCTDAGLIPPSFEEKATRIRVTFYKQKSELMANNIIDSNELFIIDLLTFCGSLSTHQIAACLNKSTRSTIHKINTLINKGRIIEISQGINDPRKRYDIKEKSNILKEKNMLNVWWEYKYGTPNGDKIMSIDDYMKIRIALGKNNIDFVFSELVIKDKFLSYDRDKYNKEEWEEASKLKVKEKIISEPIFVDFLLSCLRDQEVQKQLKSHEIPEIPIDNKDCPNFR